MRMPLTLSVLVLTFVALPGPCAGADGPQEPAEVWKEFRKAHPYHVQAVAVSRADKEGRRTVVVAEPPLTSRPSKFAPPSRSMPARKPAD
jgi:hypothetical protein